MKNTRGASNVISFVDKAEREKNYPFLHNALDRILRQLRECGIGVERKRASIITPDSECKLWKAGVIGCHSPQALLHAVFFYNGKNFCLRGVNEHQNLRFSQIVRSTSAAKYTYVEFGSKNHSGGVNDRSEGKVVSILGTDSRYCHVALLDKYLEKIPHEEVNFDSKFYLSPLPFTPLGSRAWYNKKLQDEIFYNSLDLAMGPRRFFQSVRSHTSPHTPKLATNIINIDGISYEGTDIIEGWAKYFESLGSPDHHDSTMSPDCHSDISLLLEATPPLRTRPDHRGRNCLYHRIPTLREGRWPRPPLQRTSKLHHL